MRKTLVFVMSFALGAIMSLAHADSYLYWQLDTTDPMITAGGYNTIKVSAWNRQFGAGSEGYPSLMLYTLDNAQIGAQIGSALMDAAKDGASFYAMLGGYGEGYSYAVELWNDSSVIASTDYVPYSELAATSIREVTGSTPIGMMTPWTASGFHAVPEPNSAMLLMLGLAGLALRRRREVKA